MLSNRFKVALFVGASVFAIMFIVYTYQLFFTPNLMLERQKGAIYIPRGATIKNVVDSLNRYNYLNDIVSFMFISKLLKYTDNVKPGYYVLEEKMTNLNAIRLLRSGAQTPVNVTLSNARLKEDIAQRLCRNLDIPEKELLDRMYSQEVTLKYGFNPQTISAMFIPNTYQMYWTTTADGLMDRMYMEYKNFWNEKRRTLAQSIGLSPLQVSVLASIVQAETNKREELPIVAGLYMNRLNKNIPLQADPTVVFAVGDFSINRVLNVHKETDSPYNTYKYAGLPPGPINVPFPTVIDAVLNHEKHEYLYMCAKEDFSGAHNFAKTLTEHNRNAERYQAALNKAKIMR